MDCSRPSASLPDEFFIGKPLDSDLIQALTRTYWSRVYKILSESGFPASDVEDALQESLEHLLLSAADGNPQTINEKPLEYLVTLTRRRVTKSRKTSSGPAPGDLLHSGIIDPSQRRAPSVLIAAEDLGKVKEGMDDFSDQERTIYELHQQEGLSFKEISERLGTTEEAARRTYGRAKHKLEMKRAAYSSSFATEAGTYTKKPKSRKTALGAIESLPKEARDVLTQRYVRKLPDDPAARALGLSVERYSERLARAERFFSKQFGMNLPEELETALARGDSE